MTRAAHFHATRRALVLALLVSFTSLTQAVNSQTAAPSAAPIRMVATVRAVETKTRMLEVITGVGLAMRIVRLQVAEDCEITVPWAAKHLSSFIPGTHARIEYVLPPAGTDASVQGIVVALEAIDVERLEGAK
jgi:hypothetical protein